MKTKSVVIAVGFVLAALAGLLAYLEYIGRAIEGEY